MIEERFINVEEHNDSMCCGNLLAMPSCLTEAMTSTSTKPTQQFG